MYSRSSFFKRTARIVLLPRFRIQAAVPRSDLQPIAKLILTNGLIAINAINEAPNYA
jgi:hypothetical protein